MCRCGRRNQQMGRKDTLLLYNIGSDGKTLFFLSPYFFVANPPIINAQATNRYRYIPSYHIQIYCGAPVDTNDNSNKNTSEDTNAFFFWNFFVIKSHVEKLTSIWGRKLLIMLEISKDLTEQFTWQSGGEPVTLLFA